MEEKIKVLIVDDAAFMRKAVAEILKADSRMEVVGSAGNGLECLDKIKELRPDVITLDIDMPVMDGLATIRHIMIESPVPIVVLSSLSNDGAITFDALRLGVVDFVPKPSGAVSADISGSKQQIIDRIKIACDVNLENLRRVRLSKNWNARERLDNLYKFRPLEYIVAVGTTLTGPNTVMRLLSRLSPTLPAAMVVIQDISPKIISSFVEKFDAHVPWKVEEARNDAVLEQGTCYICSNENPLSLQLNTKGGICLRSGNSTEQPLDGLFSSAAGIFHQNTIGVLLTGTGDDGVEGLSRIKKESGVTMAQDTQCCVYPNLTANAIEHGVVDVVLNEKKLAGAIESLVS